ncbi:MAG: PDZ domain-containing protein, partial [Pseudomonadota bacterium]
MEAIVMWPRRFLLLGFGFLLAACVSHEPRQLVPSINLSPDNELFSGNDGSARSGGVDFGFQAERVDRDDRPGQLAELDGVRINSVSPGGPADMAGLLPGDHVLELDGHEIDQPDQLDAIALDIDEERVVMVNVRRDTTVFMTALNVSPQSDNRVDAVELYRVDPLYIRAGFTTERLEDAEGGALSGARIVRLLDESPLRAAGLREDDIILAIAGEPVRSAQGLIDRIHRHHGPGDQVTLAYVRDNQVQDQDIELWHPGRRLSRLSLWP